MSSIAICHETIVATEQKLSTDVVNFLAEFIVGDIDETEFSNLLDMHIELSEEY